MPAAKPRQDRATPAAFEPAPMVLTMYGVKMPAVPAAMFQKV